VIDLLLDHNFDHAYTRELKRRIPELEFVTAFEVGLYESDDKQLLLWAAENRRVLFTHDRKTIPRYYAEIINAGGTSSGVLLVPSWVTIGEVIDEMELLIVCSDHDEWINRLHIV
jgi:hypothetical protein